MVKFPLNKDTKAGYFCWVGQLAIRNLLTNSQTWPTQDGWKLTFELMKKIEVMSLDLLEREGISVVCFLGDFLRILPW